MYKWGFFILLAVNTVLLGISFTKQEYPQESYVKEVIENSKALDLVNRRPVKKPNLVVNKKPKTVFVDEEERDIVDIKNALFKIQREQLSHRFSYLFNYHNISHEDFEKVLEILQKENLNNYGCFGDGIDNKMALADIIAEKVSPEVSSTVIEMIHKQSVFDSLERAVNYKIEDVFDVQRLVDSIADYHGEFIFIQGLGLDPFAEADPFSETYVESEEGECEVLVETSYERVDEQTLEVNAEIERARELEELRENLESEINQLNDKQMEFYQSYLNTLSSHVELSNEIRLAVLRELFN